MNAGLDWGTQKRENHLSSYGECGYIHRSDGGETFGLEANVRCCFVEEQDQVVKVA